jgi:DNA (cytosine-5)-methyltransferase 1
MKTLWMAEKEPFCQAILRTHFPDTELFGDVTYVTAKSARSVDVLSAGFPCQDLSVAGKRAGLEGSRSGLFWEVVRILGELRPTWFVLENVPGLFSSGEGRDFAIVLNALDELGYGLAWRVLNSQFFGVAQRRRRVFIVGCFGKPCPEEVLFEPESGCGDFAPGRETRSDIAVPLTSGLGVTGNSAGRRCEDDYNLAYCLPGHSSPRRCNPDIVQQAISSKWAKGSSGPAGDEHHNLTVVSADSQHQERSRQKFDSTGKVDGAMRRESDERAAINADRMRNTTSLPQGLDSARYRALGNAVTANVAYWIGRRLLETAL